MKIFKKFFRDEQETSVDAVQTYIVWWYKMTRFTDNTANLRRNCQVFINKNDAKSFQCMLEDCHKQLGNEHGTKVWIEELTQ